MDMPHAEMDPERKVVCLHRGQMIYRLEYTSQKQVGGRVVAEEKEGHVVGMAYRLSVDFALGSTISLEGVEEESLGAFAANRKTRHKPYRAVAPGAVVALRHEEAEVEAAEMDSCEFEVGVV